MMIAISTAPTEGAARSRPKPNEPTLSFTAKNGKKVRRAPKSTANRSSVSTGKRNSCANTNFTPAMSVAKPGGSFFAAAGIDGKSGKSETNRCADRTEDQSRNGAPPRDDQSTNCRAGDGCQLECRAVPGDGVGENVLWDELWQIRLTHRPRNVRAIALIRTMPKVAPT